MAESQDIPIDRKLSEIFQDGYDLMSTMDTCYDPTNSSEVQVSNFFSNYCTSLVFLPELDDREGSICLRLQANIKKCIGLFEDSTRLVSLCGLFSANETYDEVATDNLRYFLLPFFLGQLTLKLCNAERKEIVGVAEVYYK